jgi:hypothetical protein
VENNKYVWIAKVQLRDNAGEVSLGIPERQFSRAEWDISGTGISCCDCSEEAINRNFNPRRAIQRIR